MSKNWSPKDIAVLILAITVSSISIMSMIGVIFYNQDSGRLEELIAFLLGSMTTIIGEYILLQLKNGDK
jgi:hypothetical protein|eukprot:SAG31_NODE_1138_length_9726_cov_11.750493_13_plen_69_part_00